MIHFNPLAAGFRGEVPRGDGHLSPAELQDIPSGINSATLSQSN